MTLAVNSDKSILSVFVHKEKNRRGPVAVFFRALFWFVAASTLAACGADHRDSRAELLVLEGQTMGTYYRVSLRDSSAQLADQNSREALKMRLERRLESLNQAFSTYRDDADIVRFNQLAAGDCLSVADDFAALLAISREVNEASNGRFNPALGPLIELWGFGRSEPEALPSDAEIGKALAELDFSRVQLQGAAGSWQLCKRDRIALDLSAVAKGYGVDSLHDFLRDAGFADVLVDIGGELRGSGHNSRGLAWQVAVEEPDVRPDAAKQVLLILALQDVAIATSGNYRNFIERDGRRYGHTLDPNSGRPAENALLSVSVIHSQAAYADAWATALLAAGPERAKQLIAEHGLNVALVVDREVWISDADTRHEAGVVVEGLGDYTVWYSAGFASFIAK